MNYNKQISKICNDLSNLITIAPGSDVQYLSTCRSLLKIVNSKSVEAESSPDVPIGYTGSNVLKEITAHLDKSLSVYGLLPGFMRELRKNGGSVSGSLVLLSIMFVLHKIEFDVNDVDIFVPVNNCTIRDVYNEYSIGYVNSIIQALNLRRISSSNYDLIDGLEYNVMYESQLGLKYNFIFVTGNVESFIKTFDLGCCRNMYNGKRLEIFDFENIKNLTSTVKYNYIPIEKIYKNGTAPISKTLKAHLHVPGKKYDNKGYLTQSLLFVRYQELYDIYANNGLHQYTYYDKKNSEWHISRGWDNYDDKIKEIEEINLHFPIKASMDEIQIGRQAQQHIINVMNMIRCHDRIKKYQTRGIKKFIYN